MNIMVIGVGYVGTTTALLFAELGWKVLGIDTDETKIQALMEGKLPFYEPGLDTLLNRHKGTAQLTFSTSIEDGIEQCDILFICVGTPSEQDGSARLDYVQEAVQTIGKLMRSYKLIVVKSTVPVGTQQKVTQWIREAQVVPTAFDVVSNPEFLREGNAVYDAFHPDRIVIGCHSSSAANQVEELYAKLNSPVLKTTPATAEMIKYAANSFLAAKISYMNELARLCDKLGVSIDDVAAGMGYDPRIGNSFLNAGIGYGGSCFPKDVKSLLHTAKLNDVKLSMLESVIQINETQYAYGLEQLQQLLGTFQHKQIAVLGLAFKPGTDDMREAPSLKMIAHLLDNGAIIRAHDPIATLPVSLSARADNLAQYSSIEETVQAADAVLLCTEWPVYKAADWTELKGIMKQPIVFDGRNMLDLKQMRELGFTYVGIGNR